MSVSYPLDLFDTWPVLTKRFVLGYRQSLSRTGYQVTGADLADPVWLGSFETVSLQEEQCVSFEALLNSLGGVMETFRARDTRREYPLAQSSGVFTDTGTVAEISVDGTSLSITGLDAGFRISLGDYVTMTYGGNRYLLQCVEPTGALASGAGLTGLFQTSPPPPYDLAVGQAVNFKLPRCLMRVEPGSVAYNSGEGLTGSVSFNGVQA